MAGYRQQGFGQRLQTMGDTAEGIFAQVEPLGRFARLGWNRPPVAMTRMAHTLRHLPDFYCESGHLIEAMGCGRDGVVKLKTTKWDALKAWNQIQEVALFVWNSHRSEWALIDWPQMKRLVERARRAGIEAFENDGNTYFPISWAWLPEVGVTPVAYKDVFDATA